VAGDAALRERRDGTGQRRLVVDLAGHARRPVVIHQDHEEAARRRGIFVRAGRRRSICALSRFGPTRRTVRLLLLTDDMSTIICAVMNRRAALLGTGLLCAACGAGPRSETESPSRINDSPPEKIAAQRAASRDLQLEREDQRWGIDAARERRKDKKQAAPQTPPPAQTGPVDLQRPAPAPQEPARR
jgi:hypothetical protein